MKTKPVPRWLWIVLAVLAVLSWREWSRRDIEHSPGVLAPQQPVQRAIGPELPIVHGDFEVQRRAQFGLKARVLSTRRYWWGRQADLSPLDLALGWGPMSDQAVLDGIEISQGNRWYFTRFDLPGPLPEADIVRNSANMHMIPAEPWIEDELLALRRGDLVQFDGYLVDAGHPSGMEWRTSLSRDDTGNGSCELFLVIDIEREQRP